MMKLIFTLVGLLNLFVAVYHIVMVNFVDGFEPTALHTMRAILSILLWRMMDIASERMN